MFQPLDTLQPKQLPRTVEEVVNVLLNDLPLRDRVVLSSLNEEQLDTSVYLALAKSIREEFGLYNGNASLIASCQSYLGSEYDSYEDPAMVIIKELWRKIKGNHQLRVIKG